MPPKSKKRKDPPTSSAIANGTASTPSPPDRATWPGWVELESEPAFFNVMLRDMGVSGVKIHEVMSLDDEMLATLPQPVHALIFLFRYAETNAEVLETECPEDVWYAEQVPDFACATGAMLNIVMNVAGLALGSELRDFKSLTQPLDPHSRGEAIDDFDFVKRIHNSFARETDLLIADMHYKEKAAKAKKKLATAKAIATKAASANERKRWYYAEETPVDAAETPDIQVPSLDSKPGRNRRTPAKLAANGISPSKRAMTTSKSHIEPTASSPIEPAKAEPPDVANPPLPATNSISEEQSPPKLAGNGIKMTSKKGNGLDTDDDHLTEYSNISTPPHMRLLDVSKGVLPTSPLTEFTTSGSPETADKYEEEMPPTSPLTEFVSSPVKLSPAKLPVPTSATETSPPADPASPTPKATAPNDVRHSGRAPKPRRKTLAEPDEEEPEEEGFHFCAFLPIGDNIWKLDGMDKFPQNMGPLPPLASGQDWLSVMQPVLQARFGGDVHVNLMAVVADPMVRAKQEIVTNVRTLKEVETALASVVEDWKEMVDGERSEGLTEMSEEYEVSAAAVENATFDPWELDGCDGDLAKLLELRKRTLTEQRRITAVWRDEREGWLRDEAAAKHRRHDYGKFVKEWMGALAQQEMLTPLMSNI
ncbi:hypothetical protein B0A48_08190 [Cryoendolithus antarcticus]|uniref:ubiquitinyl hydrolase 1 n=1 Tax=Cryoendolithus antarcticus TaxID=1507870 RepID=A0A1V8T1H0_9PEZI|nr:hypothetical protein B0A48_08190 [Cryoendolithus antarcticus]